jgi:hypothetical protein
MVPLLLLQKLNKECASMRHLFTVLLMSFVLVGMSARTEASVILIADITTGAENPPTSPTTALGQPRPVPFGSATFVVNDAGTAMTFSATIFNIDFTGLQTADVNDNLGNAHIHASPTVTPTTNGPVVWGFFGSPLNDNNPNDVVVTPFATGVGGTISGKWDQLEGNATTLVLQLPNILAGHSYINFHTTQFGGGEIRGNIAAVPEPGTMLLVATGSAGLIRARAKRRRLR